MGVLLNSHVRFVNRALEASRKLLRLIPRLSRTNTNRLARFFNKGRFWISKVESRETHGASVHRMSKGKRIAQSTFCSTLKLKIPGMITIPETGFNAYPGLGWGIFNPNNTSKQLNMNEMTIKGWMMYPVR